MLKKFLMSFLGSLAALWFTGLLIVILTFSLIGLVMSSDTDSDLRDKSILYLNLTGNIEERSVMPNIRDLAISGYSKTQGLDEILRSVRSAAENDRIEGIFINCDGSQMGYASREELLTALRAFKESGKWIYAYGESVSQGDYYVASCADRFFLNPSGMVDVRGMASQIPFFKDALDKLGVEVQVMKVGTFKSAVEPYILNEPSEPSLMQTMVFLNAIWNNVSGSIAEGRGVKPADVNAWADSIIVFRPAETALENKVVSELKYRRQVDEILREKTGLDSDEDIRFVTPSDYLSADKAIENIGLGKNDSHIAVYYAFGDIVDDGNEGIVGSKVTADIVKLADDKNVAALVLRVNSGGGSAFASEQIWESLEYFKSKGKPFYVSMGDYAASGGYYISCGADRIFADNNTLTGSIGIFGMIPCVKGLLKDKIGVNFATIATNPDAAFPNLFDPLTPVQHAAIQTEVENGYKLFTKRVADGRELPIDSVLTIAEGRVWDGATALRIGLVDELGGIHKAIAAIADEAGLEPTDCVSYPAVDINSMEMLMFSILNSKAEGLRLVGIEGIEPEQARKAVRHLKSLQTMGKVQARMEEITLY